MKLFYLKKTDNFRFMNHSRPRKRKVSGDQSSESKEFPIGSVDDPLGLDSLRFVFSFFPKFSNVLSHDAIINDVEENEFNITTEKESANNKIPENLTDPLGLDEEDGKAAAKKQRKGSKSGSQVIFYQLPFQKGLKNSIFYIICSIRNMNAFI